MAQRIRERRFEKLNSKGEIIEIIEETFKGKTEAFGKMLLQTSNHNLYHSGTRTLPGEKRYTEVKKEENNDIKRFLEKRKEKEAKEKEAKEKLRTKKGVEGRYKNKLNENRRKSEQEKKLFYEKEEKNKIKTNNIGVLEGNNNRVEKKLNNDNNFSIIKNVELKTFYTDYIQKKFIADENAFPNRNSLKIKNN